MHASSLTSLTATATAPFLLLTKECKNRHTDRQTYRHFIRRILMYIVIRHGLQYNTHESGYLNKQDTNKGNKNKIRKTGLKQ